MAAGTAAVRRLKFDDLTGLSWTKPSTRVFAAWCAVAAAALLAVGLELATGLGGAVTARTVSNVALVAASLAAAASCWHRAWRTAGRIRGSWVLFGVSALSWGSGRGVWAWYESLLGTDVPFPSMADVGCLGAVPLMAAALFTLPMASQSLANRVRSVFDGLLIAASLLLVSWVLVLGPLIQAGGDSLLGLAISLSYPIGDVVVVTVVLFMLARSRQGGAMPVPLALLGTGLLAYAVSDSGFVFGTLTGTYASGALIDLGWFAGFLLIMLAARKPAPPATEQVPAASGAQALGVLLPYLAVLAGLAANVIYWVGTGAASSGIFWIRSAIIALMVGRQFLTLLENVSLTRHLEARVAARTAELQASEQRFEALVQHSSDVVTVVDQRACVMYRSESVKRVFGYTADELSGRPLTCLMDLESGARLRSALADVAGQPYGTMVVELTVRHRDGRMRQAEMTITNLLEDTNVDGLVLNTRDISERKELEDQLVHEAFHDSLTRLANRVLFKDRVDQALRRRRGGKPVVGVLFLDLDGFKEVNDSLGHASGDQLLIQVAERLSSSVRPEDTVARFGGDEFAVLIEEMADDWAAEEVARRLVEGLREPFTIEGQELHVRASIGIAVSEQGEQADDADQLMRNADLAMYQAKAGGFGGYTSYDPRMHTGLVERLQLEADLRRALEAEEFTLHYQPTIALATGEITGFEALVRWQHPTRGLVPPADFIPLAETTGLIRPLGRWVLDEACRQAAAWNAGRDGRPLTMSVNVSGRQFDQSDLPTVVSMALAANGLPPEHLCLEMTESVLMNDTEENLALLKRLRALGVRLAIDDFGTGYSSLSYLHRFPVDTLKIDRSFVERLSQASHETALARTIVQLGQSLGMVTVAEGIEQYAQFLALNRMTCELGQGYYFSRPLPAYEAGRLLDDAGAGSA